MSGLVEIWLEPPCCVDPSIGRMWCEHALPDCDECGTPAVRYVRADALQAASKREARADHSRAVYARALEGMLIALVDVHDHIKEDGDRVYFGSTNHADDLKAAWQLADALKWDEVMEDTQPKTELAAVNLRLQDELKAASEREAKLVKALENIASGCTTRAEDVDNPTVLWMQSEARQALGREG